MENKKLNKKATLKNISNRANQSIGISINVKGFNEKVKEEGNDFIIEAAEFIGAEVVYH